MRAGRASVWIALSGVTFVGCLLVSSRPALAGATELFREQTTVTVERNTITADSTVRYGGYVAGETIPITLEYMATCNVVFGGLTLVRRAPFGPSAGVSGDIGNITAVPAKGYPASMGSVTFDLKFNSLGRDAGDGDVSGLVRLNLVLGVDKDCDLPTGDTDGVDGSTTIRVDISVSEGP